jgi:hypothetical protein
MRMTGPIDVRIEAETVPNTSFPAPTQLIERLGGGAHRAAGFDVLVPAHPIREVWHLVAHTAQHPGLMLVGVFATAPDPRSPRLALPGGFHPGTRRLIHTWAAEGPLPQALLL